MAWTKLDPGAHVAMWCATEGCWGIPFHRLEVDGVASNYCTRCRSIIEINQSNYKHTIVASVDGL